MGRAMGVESMTKGARVQGGGEALALALALALACGATGAQRCSPAAGKLRHHRVGITCGGKCSGTDLLWNWKASKAGGSFRFGE